MRNDGNAARREWKIANKLGAVLDQRGHRDYRKFYKLEERFEQLPGLAAALILADASGGAGPNAAAFAAAMAANRNFEHLGTGTEVVTFANQFDFGAGAKLCTATADASSCIVLPSTIADTDLALGQTAWGVDKQWTTERSPRFECVITPTPASQITTVALTSNVALITTGAAHGLFPGETVTIALDQADSDYAATSSLEGSWTVLSVATTTTFTFAYTRANISSASIAGSCRQSTNQVSGPSGLAITNIASDGTDVTITTAQKHGLSANCLVTISVDQTSAAYIAATDAQKALVLAIQGAQTVTSAYSAAATTFTFAKTSTAITTAAYTGKVFERTQNAQLTKTAIWAGFKKTNTPVVATDNDQAYLLLDTAVSATPITLTAGAISPYWNFVTSRGGVDTVTVLTDFLPPEMGKTYRIEIEIDTNRIPSLWINGQKAVLGDGAAALSWGIDLIPYVGVAASGVVPAAKAITLEYISCSRESDNTAV